MPILHWLLISIRNDTIQIQTIHPNDPKEAVPNNMEKRKHLVLSCFFETNHVSFLSQQNPSHYKSETIHMQYSGMKPTSLQVPYPTCCKIVIQVYEIVQLQHPPPLDRRGIPGIFLLVSSILNQ